MFIPFHLLPVTKTLFSINLTQFVYFKLSQVAYFKRTLKLMELTSRYLKFFAWLTTDETKMKKKRNKELKRLNIFRFK